MTNIVAAFRACTTTLGGAGSVRGAKVHAGVLAELIAEGTGGAADTVVRSTLTGDVWRVYPLVIELVDLDAEDGSGYDIVADMAYSCRCPEVN